MAPQPPGMFDQTAEAAFRATVFPPRDAAENIRRGLAAVDQSITKAMRGGPGVVHQAMYRDDVGSITIIWGKPGDPTNRYSGGAGLSHIIAKHGAEAVEPVLETIARSGKVKRVVFKNKDRRVLRHGSHEVILDLRMYGKRMTWLLTGYKIGPDTDIPTNLDRIPGPFFFRP